MSDSIQLQQEVNAMNVLLSQLQARVAELEVAPADPALIAKLQEMAEDQNDMGLWQDAFNPADQVEVENGAHILEGAGKPVLSRTPKPYHFQVIREPEAPTSVRVRGGRWTRTADSVQTTVTMTVDTGTAGSQDSYKTLTGFSSASTTYWVYVDIDDNVTPTTLTADKTTSYPTGDTTNTRRVLARVVTNSDGEIDVIEQIYHGGDIDDWWHQYVNAALDTANTGQTVIQNLTWDSYGHTLTVSNYDIKNNFYTESEIDTMLNDGTINHGDLSGLANDDHGQYWLRGAAYTRNYGSSIGSDASTIKVDLTNSQLEGNWETVGVHTATQFYIDATHYFASTGALNTLFTVAGAAQDNHWDNDDAKLQVTTDIFLAAGNDLDVHWSGDILVQGDTWEVRKVRMIDDDSGAEITRDVLMSVA